MKIRLALFGIACLALLAACRVEPDVTPHFMPALEPFDPNEPGWIATRPVLLVADCQLHNLYSLPIPERNLTVKMLADTAIRPPQLDMFARDALQWILENGTAGTEAIIHLGDAVDQACEGEFVEFLQVMERAGKPWLLVPGNHECFYFGTFTPRTKKPWRDACNASGRPLTKDLYLRLHVAAMIRQGVPGTEALAADLGLSDHRDLSLQQLADRIPLHHTWEAPADLDSFLRAMAWNIDEKRPWRSFLLQRADLSGPDPRIRFQAILLDSTQYAHPPSLVPNAWDNYPLELNCGMAGEILADQLRLVRRWIEAHEKTEFVLMFHHPFDMIASKSRSSLKWLWAREPFSVIVTAHTHGGRFVHHELEDGRDDLEVNVGSTTDWPMEWRTLVVYLHEKTRECYLQSRRFTLVDVLKNRKGFFQRGWEVPPGAEDDYRKYRVGEPSGITIYDFLIAYHIWPPILGRARVPVTHAAYNTEMQVKDTMLWTYHRLIRTFATDPSWEGTDWPTGCAGDDQVEARIDQTVGMGIPIEKKIALIRELERFERSRRTRNPTTGGMTDEVRRRFRISQAVWASRFELTGGRLLSPEDELIRVGRLEPSPP